MSNFSDEFLHVPDNILELEQTPEAAAESIHERTIAPEDNMPEFDLDETCATEIRETITRAVHYLRDTDFSILARLQEKGVVEAAELAARLEVIDAGEASSAATMSHVVAHLEAEMATDRRPALVRLHALAYAVASISLAESLLSVPRATESSTISHSDSPLDDPALPISLAQHGVVIAGPNVSPATYMTLMNMVHNLDPRNPAED